MNPKVVLKDVTKSYPASAGQVEALSNITLSVAEGEFLSLIGVNSSCQISTILV